MYNSIQYRYLYQTIFLCVSFCIGAVFTLMSLLVICIATTSLVQLHTRILGKFLPSLSPTKEEEEDVEDEEVMKTVKQFRYR